MIKRYFKEAIVLPQELVEQKELMSHKLSELKEMALKRNIELSANPTKIEIVKALSESDK